MAPSPPSESIPAGSSRFLPSPLPGQTLGFRKAATDNCQGNKSEYHFDF